VFIQACVQHGPPAGGGADPQPRQRRLAGDQLAQPDREGGDLDRQVGPVGAATESLEPPPGGVVHPGQRAGRVQQYQSRTVGGILQLACLAQQAHPDALGQVRGQPLNELCLLQREGGLGRLAMQALVTRAAAAPAQHHP
jgi:hypothetical protein